MKVLFVLIMFLASYAAGSTPGNQGPVHPAVLESFNNAFRNAEEVNWTESKEFYKAQFRLNCQHVFAFYAKNGSLIATTRNMLFTELPVILQTSLEELQNGYWITDLFELSNDEGTNYFITLENADTRLVLRSNKSDWDIYQKRLKD